MQKHSGNILDSNYMYGRNLVKQELFAGSTETAFERKKRHDALKLPVTIPTFYGRYQTY